MLTLFILFLFYMCWFYHLLLDINKFDLIWVYGIYIWNSMPASLVDCNTPRLENHCILNYPLVSFPNQHIINSAHIRAQLIRRQLRILLHKTRSTYGVVVHFMWSLCGTSMLLTNTNWLVKLLAGRYLLVSLGRGQYCCGCRKLDLDSRVL